MSTTKDRFPTASTDKITSLPTAQPVVDATATIAPDGGVNGAVAAPVQQSMYVENGGVYEVNEAEVGQPGGVTINVPPPIALLPLSIQRGFRIKMLTILLLQLLLTMGVSILLHAVTDGGDPDATPPRPPTGLAVLFPPGGVQTLVLGVVCLGALPLLTQVRDKHPWNLICTTLWTLAWALFIAMASLPGALVRSHVLFVIFGSTTLGVGCLLLLSSCITVTDPYTQQKKLMSFGSAG